MTTSQASIIFKSSDFSNIFHFQVIDNFPRHAQFLKSIDVAKKYILSNPKNTGSFFTYPSKVDAFLGLMELDQNNKLDDFVISRYESFTVPNQKFNQTINYINIERSMKNFFLEFFWGFLPDTL